MKKLENEPYGKVASNTDREELITYCKVIAERLQNLDEIDSDISLLNAIGNSMARLHWYESELAQSLFIRLEAAEDEAAQAVFDILKSHKVATEMFNLFDREYIEKDGIVERSTTG